MIKTVEHIKVAKQISQLPDYHSFGRQLFEMLLIFALRGIGPGYYLMAEMGKKHYDNRYKLGFLNGSQYVKRINQINNLKYYSATFNKLIEKALLTTNGIPTPRMLGYLHPVRGRTTNGESLKTVEDLSRFIDLNHNKRLCFKLISGDGGAGFRAIEVIENSDGFCLRDLKDDTRFSVDEFYSQLGDASYEFLIEEYLEQHPEVKKLNPSSVNTLRVMLYQKTGSLPRCIGTYLRIGRQGSLVDNGSVGGMGVKVDMANATLGKATFSYTREHALSHHPDSGVEIEGARIPFLTEAIELASEAIQVFPEINFGVLDIAIGVDGPRVIEMNARADYVDFAILNVPSRLVLCES